MRRFPAAVAVLGLAAVALVGCSSSSTAASCGRETDAGNLADVVSVEGEFGETPDVDVSTPFAPGELHYYDISTGEGTALTEPGQLYVMGLTLINGETGDTIVEQGYDAELSAVGTYESWSQVIPGLEDALHCATAGTRVVVGLSTEALGDAATQLQLDEDATAVAVVDVRKVYLPAADGAPQFNEGRGLPTVVLAPSGQPGVIIPDAEAPAELTVNVLKKGDGEAIDADSIFRLAYTGVGWDSREQFTTSWGSAAPGASLSSLSPALAEQLDGMTVGSQLLVVIPADAVVSDPLTASAPDESALVFVLDILGTDGPAAN